MAVADLFSCVTHNLGKIRRSMVANSCGRLAPASIVDAKNRVVDYPLAAFAFKAFEMADDFHAPSWAQFGNVQCNGAAIRRDVHPGNRKRFFIVMFGAIIRSPPKRPGLNGVMAWISGECSVQRVGIGDFNPVPMRP